MWHFLQRLPPPAIGFLFVLTAVSLSFLSYFMAHMLRKKKIAIREIVPFRQWYETHYGMPGILPPEDVCPVLSVIANEIGVSPTQLVPTDDLSGHLALNWVIYDDTAESLGVILNAYVKRITGKGLRGAKSWRTVDDMIRGVVSQVR